MCQQRLGAISPIFKPLVATLGEWTIARQLVTELGFCNVEKLLASHIGLVEWDPIATHIQPSGQKIQVESFWAFHNAV